MNLMPREPTVNFKSAHGRNAKGKITNERWDKAKNLIQTLYMDHNKPFSYVANVLWAECGFLPTKREFDRRVVVKWGLKKNTSIAERRLAVARIVSTEVDRHQTCKTLDLINRPLNSKKLKRWKRDLAGIVVSEMLHPSSQLVDNSFVPPDQDSLIEMTMDDRIAFGVKSDEDFNEQNIIWAQVRITDSPELSDLFARLAIIGYDPENQDIPDMSLLEASTVVVHDGEHHPMSALAMQCLKLPFANTGKHFLQSQSMALTLRDKSLSNADSSQDHIALPSHAPTQDAPISPYYELYPFVNLTTSQSLPIKNSVTTNLSHYYLEEKLQDLRQTMDSKHPEVFNTMDELASIYKEQESWAEAHSMYDKLVAIYEEIFGIDNLRTLEASLELNYSLYMRKSYDVAYASHRKVHSKIMIACNHSHGLVGRSMSLLAAISFFLGNLEETEQLNRQLVQIKLTTQGPRSRGSIACLGNLAHTLKFQYRYSTVEKLLRTMIQIQSEIPDFSESLKDKTWRRYAGLAAAQGNISQATNLYEHLLRRIDERSARNDSGSLAAMVDFAKFLAEQNQPDKSIDLMNEIVSRSKENLTESHPSSLSAFRTLANILFNYGNFNEASAWFEKSVAGCMALYGVRNWVTLDSCHGLAMCYQRTGQQQRALALCEWTFEKIRNDEGSFDKVRDEVDDIEDLASRIEEEIAEASSNICH